MTFDQIIANLKRKVYHPVYFLQGDEPYFIDQITSYIEDNVLDDMEKEFNQTVLYGRDVDAGQIMECAKRFPMMSNHQVVIVREAQGMRKIEDLEAYVDNPLESTILVLCHKYKSIDKRKKFAKTVAAKGVLFESKKLYENKVPDWISSYCTGKGHQVETKATILLTEFLGTDLAKISNELDKLALNMQAGETITPDHIERYIGISKDYNNFELQNALGHKDVLKANRIVTYFAGNEREHPLVVTLGILYGFFSKLLCYHYLTDKSRNNVASVLRVNPFFVKDYQQAAQAYSAKKVVRIISYLRDYDLRSKGVGNVTATQGELLKELVYKILH